jgi:predicted adenylyl cyclase CyaB
MIEVELKARLRDREAVLATVAGFARDAGEVDKFDSYWHGPDWRIERGKKGFRLRSEGGSTVVAFKTKRSEGGMEINREREIGVSDAEAFVEFCIRLGCEPFYSKRKRGRKFLVGAADGDAITIEIVEVLGLGHFIEIEALLAEEDPAAIALAQGEIRGLLARAGVPAEDIEPRFYSELLVEAGMAPGP